MKNFDTVIIGTGPCSEPVINQIAKSKLFSCIIDIGDIDLITSPGKLKKNYVANKNLTPKQKLEGFLFTKKNYFNKLSNFLYLKSKNFTYIYSLSSGGLSNIWGGGAFEWPDWELSMTTSLPIESIKKAYRTINRRLNIKKRNEFSSLSGISEKLISIRKNNQINFRPAMFFLNQNEYKNDEILFNQNMIWNSAYTIKKYIKKSSNLIYKKNTIVLSISRNKKGYWEIKCLSNNKLSMIRAFSIILCAGTLSSTALAFSASKFEEVDFKFKHNNALLVPLLNFKNKSSFNKENLELPELSWIMNLYQKNIKNNQLISGYFINSLFIKKIILSKSPFFLKKFIEKIIINFLSRVNFLTIFLTSNSSNVSLNLKKDKKYNFVFATINNHTNKRELQKFTNLILDKIKNALPNKLFLLKIFHRLVTYGGDVHYACTMPDKIAGESKINTSEIGELTNLPNIYSCDPSRLGYLSSLPHTFTVMAIAEASMPRIIKKIKSKKTK